jgi:Tfp pilus assembly protein PilF
LSLIWRKRWLTGAGVALALLAGAFLVLLNIAGGPLEGLRNQPGFGRLGQLLDADSRTGKVRTLIWQGASELVTPHEPLEYPDGEQDVWNALRPVIGYGPEAMYVAYNRFYPPELSLVEKRNASPDRAHNETWDVLVATGLVGLLAYLSLFGSLIYYALKWLGLIRNKRQRNLFLSFSFLGGAVSTVVFVAWQGVAYFGVALPFGILLGMIAYLLLSSMAGWFEPVTTSAGRLRAYLLLGFFAAIVAHFMEINFGIAISVTRLYFWVYAALIILLGYRLPQLVVFQDAQNISEVSDYRAGTARNPDARFRPVMTKRRKEGSAAAVRRKGRTLQASERNWVFSEFTQNMIVLALVLAILMATLGYNFLTNNQRFLSFWTVIWVSLSWIKSADYPSYGLLALVITTWLVGGAVLAAEQQRRRLDDQQNFWKLWLGVLTISMLAAGSYWLIQASNLVALAKSTASSLEDVLRQVHMSENLLGVFNFFMLALLTILAFVFAYRQTVRLKVSRFFAGLPGLAVLLLALIFASYSNLRIVQADVAFKAAELFTQPKSWPVAILLAPKEDYYYLFLGRAYLESAKLIADPEESDALISQAAADLRTAQALNPLNTDHTANLARLYSVWANSASDPILQDERAAISEAYFEQALKLSPNNARLWNEWAMLYLNILSQPEKAYERIKTALALDPSYDWSYALLGDYYSSLAAQTSGAQARVEALQNAAAAYQNALQRAGPESSSLRFNYALALGSIQMQLGQLEAADQSLSLALNLAQPEEKWRAFEALAFNAHQKGELAKAREYASQALEAAPEAAKDRLRQSLDRLSD